MPQMYKVFFNNNVLVLSNQPLPDQKPDITYIFTKKKDLEVFLFGYCDNTEHKIINIQYFDIDKLWKKFQKLFKVKTAGGGLVVNSNNEILFIKRRGLWDLPKGHQEEDESIELTSIREVEEECGIANLTIKRKLIITYHTYWLKDKAVLKPTHWFKMKYNGNQNLVPQLEEEITEASWFSKADLCKIYANTYPSIIDVVNNYFASQNA